MKKTTLAVLIGIPLVIVALAGTKALQINKLVEMGESYQAPPVKVTYIDVQQQQWANNLSTVASLEANQWVNLAAEQPGKVTAIHFKSGARVEQGDILLEQDTSTEQAQLKAGKSALKLAQNQLQRIKALKKQRNASQSSVEDALARVIQAEADIEVIQTQIDKKRIKAPFSGQLGISTVNLGQELSPGDVIVNLQQLQPMLVNFYLPQSYLGQLSVGLPVTILDAKTSELLKQGKITAIDPQVDNESRNVRIQASVDNQHHSLFPGMFVNIAVNLGETPPQTVVPSTAIRYAPYGSSVYVIDQSQSPATVHQQIIETGSTRGDFTVITKGLQGDEVVVSSGAFKLQNGQTVELDNSKAPTFKLDRSVKDS